MKLRWVERDVPAAGGTMTRGKVLQQWVEFRTPDSGGFEWQDVPIEDEDA